MDSLHKRVETRDAGFAQLTASSMLPFLTNRSDHEVMLLLAALVIILSIVARKLLRLIKPSNVEEDMCPICHSKPKVVTLVEMSIDEEPDSADKAFIEAATLMIRRERQQPLTSPVDDGEIRRTLERALALDPHDIKLLVTLVEMLIDEEPARAEQLWRTAIAELTESIAPAHMALGKTLRNLGNFEGSVVELRKVIQLAKYFVFPIRRRFAGLKMQTTTAPRRLRTRRNRPAVAGGGAPSESHRSVPRFAGLQGTH